MKKIRLSKIKKINHRHYVCAGLCLASCVLTVTVFPAAFTRIGESFRDLWTSFLYYIKQLFELETTIPAPTVNDFSSVGWTPVFGLPETWEGFKLAWSEFWSLFFSGENFSAFFVAFGEGAQIFVKIFLLAVIPLILIMVLMFRRYLQKQNNDYNRDSAPLRFFKKAASVTYIPVKRWLSSLMQFLKENKNYVTALILIWMFNFNFITVIVEFVAFYLYFVTSFDFIHIYRQVYKLLVDLTPVISFIPTPVWILFGYFVFCKIRAGIAYDKLGRMEKHNRGFISDRPIVYMVCGTMGKKKTTAITDMLLTQEVMFRDKALEKLLENDMKFPNFPWINLENNIKWAMENHKIYNLATCRDYIRRVRSLFLIEPENERELRLVYRQLKRRYGLSYENMLYDYDYERYGYYYDNSLVRSDVWSVIETYTQLYFIYITSSALIFSNYSIRTDTVVSDLGNFPLRDSNFFERRTKDMDFISRYSKIADFDAFRLARRMNEFGVNKDAFEFGAVGITEVGKERKNTIELQDKKRKDDSTNQKNDGFNDWLKMIRHSATVDNYPFVKVITDEQRPESWGADARDLLEIVHIRESSDTKLALPFFSIFELLHYIVCSKFQGVYLQYRHVRSDNTLPLYLFKKLASFMEHRYKRLYNTFGYCKLSVEVERGTQDAEPDKLHYFLCSKKIYSKRFSTDCFSDYFAKKAMRSPVGIDDMAEYEGVKATFDELKSQNSYFINDLIGKQENKE